MKVMTMSIWVGKYAAWIFFFILLFFFAGMIIVIGLNHPFWTDEEHFIATIRHFGENLNVHVFVDYDQVTGPLVYFVYALWGKMVGFETAHLRLLSLLFSAVTLTMIFILYVKVLANAGLALLGFCLLLLDPYMWGLSFFVYTDMPALCFLVMIAWAVRLRRPLLLMFATAMAVLTRQYMIFLVLAAGLYHLVDLLKGNGRGIAAMLALAVGVVPLFVLMLIWGGIAPPSGMSRWVMTDGQMYHFDAVTTYIAFTALYLLPVIVLIWRRLVKNHAILLACAFLSGWWYLMFPVRPSLVTSSQTHYDTIGLAHRLIKTFIGEPVLENVLLGFFFFCGLLCLSNIVFLDLRRLRNDGWDFRHFLTASMLFFLLVMPLSYQVWEKYLVAVLPFIMLRLLLFMNEQKDFARLKLPWQSV